MAVIPINDLTEITEAGENDYLLISTSNGAKKIKASAVGGGGEFLVTFSQDSGTGSITSNKTIKEIATAYWAGKTIKAMVDSSTSSHGSVIYLFISSIDFHSLDTYDNNMNTIKFVLYPDDGMVIYLTGEYSYYTQADTWNLSMWSLNEYTGG